MKKLVFGLVLVVSLTVGLITQNHGEESAVYDSNSSEKSVVVDKNNTVDTAAWDPNPGGG
jgi:hypothetical protein